MAAPLLTPWEYVTTAETRSGTVHLWKAEHRDGFTAWNMTRQPAPGSGVDFVKPRDGGGFYTSFNGLMARSGIVTDYRDETYTNYAHIVDASVTLESALHLAAEIAGRRVSIMDGEEVLRAETLKTTRHEKTIPSYELLKFATSGHRWDGTTLLKYRS